MRQAMILALTPCLAACITSHPPLETRFFRPSPTPAGTAASGPQTPIRLARPTAAAHLRERMVWRVSPVEIVFDEANRWATPPADLVEDALVRALVAAGFCPTDVPAPLLEVHVSAFERDATQVTVELIVTLHGVTAAPRTVTVRGRHPVEGDGPEAFAAAAGPALTEAARAVAALAAE